MRNRFWSVWLHICFLLIMSFIFSLEEFVEEPSLEVFYKCSKDQIIAIAEHYEVHVSKQSKKDVLKTDVLHGLVERGIFPPSVVPKSPPSSAESVRLKELELEIQRLSLEKTKVEQDTQIRLRELELAMQRQQLQREAQFDVSKNIRLVPHFNEKDVEK